jgi:undecaprenyl phosphate N,N'-diacetylbacillosamine 1-phosphate transferase
MLTEMHRSTYARFGKRILDLLVTAPLLIVACPLLLLVAAAVRLTSRGPALFRQARLGRNGVVFEVLKLRTMTHRIRVPDTITYSGDPAEITLLGRMLRRSKLDELPQLVNVIRGEMSLVGPRPQLPSQLQELDDNGRLRLLVRPGLTGLAQTHGNVALTWPERWFYDAQYVRRLSLRLDLWILARTIGMLIRGEEHYLRRPTAPEMRKELI